jgi:hypothetical protein
VSDLWQTDPDLGESLQPREEEIAEQVRDFIAAGIEAAFQAEGAPARRDAHPKAHGCVRAEFRVEESLPPQLAQGVFVPGATYAAWIRFSNGNPDVRRPDYRGDVRAMAIKLLGVPGEKLLESDREATTQDFILMNSPVFFACDALEYLSVVKREKSANPVTRFFAPLALGLRGAAIGLKMLSSRIGDPLAVRYWSTVPFRLGDEPHKLAVKYSAVPHARAVRVPLPASPQFLREAMIAHLRVGDVAFDFLIQPRTSAAMSVEDSCTEWKEAEAPFYKVATIAIPRQEFATTENDALAENLAFNPWHALPQHRPLGCVNRTRRIVYEATSELRRRRNGAALQEPKGTPVPCPFAPAARTVRLDRF